MIDPVKTGLLIRNARIARSLTQKQLAALLHISDRTVSKWERGAGLPDIALLEPLADALGLSVQGLLRGEADTAAPAEEDAVRAAVRLVYQASRQALRRNLSRILVGVGLLIFLGFMLFAALDLSGAFLTSVQMEVPAVLYRNGEAVGETVVQIDGTQQTLYDPSFFGRFCLAEAPKTTTSQTNSVIKWDEPEAGFQTIVYTRPGVTRIDAGVESYLYISPDMKQFALTLADGIIVATNEALAKLQALEQHRYALQYEAGAYPYFSYHHAD